MYNLIRFYNRNKRTIIKIILIIALIIVIIQLFNNFYKNRKDNKNDRNIKNNTYQEELISDKSSITGESVYKEDLKNDVDIINQFVNYCNNKDVDDAYQLLNDDCKEEIFPTIKDFEDIYYSKIFTDDNKSYTVENWVNNTYRVLFTGDILSTGKLDNSDEIQDYITVTKKNDEYKLNINNYIGRQYVNKITDNDNIKITVESIDTYMDYEKYNLIIENNSDNSILLDTGNDTKSIYLENTRNSKYYFYNNEIINSNMLIQSKYKNKLTIKFMKSFDSSVKIKKLVFSKFVNNYEEYKKIENKEDYNISTFNVSI